MANWCPLDYLRFEEERTQPCRDLAGRIRLESPRSVIDLGCGPGNSTAVLAARWPLAVLTGLDSSFDMLERARMTNSHAAWIQADIAGWASAPAEPVFDLVFSNAALQWVPDHAALYPRLLERVRPGGVLAIQVPADIDAPAHRMMRELAASVRWRSRFQKPVNEWYVHDAAFYYDLLAKRTRRLEIWRTEYFHVLPDAAAIADWYRATGLRAFLDSLQDEADRNAFVADYGEAVQTVFPPRADGRLLFPFLRLFLIAEK